MDKRASQQLVKARKAVKEKYRKLKSDTAATEFHLEKSYKPIIQPLKQLVTKINENISLEPKQEIKEEKYEDYVLPYISTPKKGRTPQLPSEMPSFLDNDSYERVLGQSNREVPFQQTSVISASNSQLDLSGDITPTSTLEQILNDTKQTVQQYIGLPSYKDYLEEFNELPRSYIDADIRDTQDQFDHRFGVVHDLESGKFFLGLTQVPIEFKGKDITIMGVTYTGTVGLYELLFKKNPTGYKVQDLDNYIDILTRTSAYKDEQGNLHTNSNRYAKFRTIILPYLHKKGITKKGARALGTERGSITSRILFNKPPPPTSQRTTRQTAKTGKGLILKNNCQHFDYVYWDDPNELVNRLRLLIASSTAGNNIHQNEVLSLLEELREAKIIE